MSDMQNIIPSVVFIVPYRNRHQHKAFFLTYLTSILPSTLNYEIFFSHQCDVRSFNRGAVKNIGFIAVKNKYPNDYKNITFVFNDIDTLPFTNLFDYETIPGIVKHFYGFTYALGGIASITGEDMEKINGYPNFWGWGMEDNVLQKRCELHGIQIDRSNFHKIGSPNIIHLFDGVSRIINRKDPYRATHDNGIDGINTITKLKYNIKFESDNPIDNINHTNLQKTSNIYFININNFLTGVSFEIDDYFKYDLREPPRQIINPLKIKHKVVNHVTNDWSNIPYYLNKNITVSEAENQHQTQQHQTQQHQTQQHQTQQHQQVATNNYHKHVMNLIKAYQHNQHQRTIESKKKIIPQNVNKFSNTVNVKLGGLY